MDAILDGLLKVTGDIYDAIRKAITVLTNINILSSKTDFNNVPVKSVALIQRPIISIQL